MKRFFACVVVALLLMPITGCGPSEKTLYERWEKEHREEWEQEAFDNGYKEGYDVGLEDGIEEGRLLGKSDYEDEIENEATVRYEEFQTYLDQIQKQVDEICAQTGCVEWEKMSFSTTAEMQAEVIGNSYFVSDWFSDVIEMNGNYILRIENDTTLFYVLLTKDQYEEIKPGFDNYDWYAVVLTVTDVIPTAAYISASTYYDEVYKDAYDDDWVLENDINIEFDIDPRYRIVLGTCVDVYLIEE